MLRMRSDVKDAGAAGPAGDSPAADAGYRGLPMPRRFYAIAAISFGLALLVIDGQIANVALPTLSRELGVGEGAITSVVTIYQLVMVMGLLPLASLGDRIGHRKLYQIGQLVFCIASALCFFVDSFSMLLVLRAGQAIGASMAMAVNVALVRAIYPEKSLGAGLGFNSIIIASSAALAPTLGGYIVAHFPWQAVFFVAAPLAVISLLLGRALPDPQPRPGKTDWTGGIWSAVTMALLIGGLQLASHENTRWLGIASVVAGVASTWFLVKRESTRDRPIVPVDLLKMPVIGLSALAAIAVFLSAGALMITLPFRLEQGMGYSPDQVGLLLLPFPLTMLFVSPTAGWLSDRVAASKLGVPGLIVAIIGLVLLAMLPDDAGGLDVAWRLSITAAGFGFFLAPNSRLAIGNAPMHRSAAAGGVLSTSRLLGQATAAAVVGLLLGLGLGLGPVPFYVSIGFAVLAAACTMFRFNTVTAAQARQSEASAAL